MSAETDRSSTSKLDEEFSERFDRIVWMERVIGRFDGRRAQAEWDVVAVLEARGFAVDDEVRARIAAMEPLYKVLDCLLRAVTAASIDEALEVPEEN